MIIPSIGKQKIAYKDHESVKFESLDFYIKLAQKTISKLGRNFFTGLSKEMLSSEDAIAFVANAIMMGDWRWKDNKDNEDMKHKNLYSYRNQCAIWAMKTYITKKYNKKNIAKNSELSISSSHDEDMKLSDIIPDNKQQTPINLLIDKENNILFNELLSKLFNSDIITEKQKNQIKMYYMEDYTLDKIGKHYNVTREAVRQSIKSAISKIRSLV
jgi:RNA polymerase sigma factor (sigma-70 family)